MQTTPKMYLGAHVIYVKPVGLSGNTEKEHHALVTKIYTNSEEPSIDIAVVDAVGKIFDYALVSHQSNVSAKSKDCSWKWPPDKDVLKA